MATQKLAPADAQEVRNMIASAVSREVSSKINGMADDIKVIKRTLCGDPQYNEKGMKAEHDEMWQSYSGAKFILKALGLTNLITAISSIVALLKAFGIF